MKVSLSGLGGFNGFPFHLMTLIDADGNQGTKCWKGSMLTAGHRSLSDFDIGDMPLSS